MVLGSRTDVSVYFVCVYPFTLPEEEDKNKRRRRRKRRGS